MIEFLLTIWPTLALLGVMAVLFLLLRNRASPVSTTQGIFAQGQPTVVEVFSNT